MKIKTLISICIIGLMVSCAPATKLEKSWADPSLTPETIQAVKKVLVVAGLPDESSKRITEDKIVGQLKNIQGIQSYTYLTAADTDEKQVAEKLKKDGFDGIILLRLKEVQKSTSYTPGTSYGGWYGYRYASPGYYSENENFLVETNLYSLVSDKLLWSGTTSTLNPTSLDKTMDQIIATIRFELQKKGFLKSK